MPNVQKLNQNKERILSTIRFKGPALPVQISKAINLPPLFASAFLSELYGEKRIKMSNMKVGSSPLYYIPGQESLLENFVEHLNGRERDAFEALKKDKVLDDEKQAPVIRVALRAIKDFASPVKVKTLDGIRTIWRYFTLSDQEFIDRVQELFSRKSKPVSAPKPAPIPKPEPRAPEPPAPKPVEKSPTPIETPTPQPAPIPKPEKPKTKETEFSKDIKEYLEAKDIELLESISEKKREFISKVRIDTMFGKQTYLLIAKDKKSITDNDLTIAAQKAQAEKMPALVLSPGELNKKGKEHLKEWGNLVKYEKLNF